MSESIERVLVLGHTGFIGSRLFDYLQHRYPQVKTVGRAPASLDLTERTTTESLSGIIDETTAVVMCAAVKRQFGDTLEAYTKNMAMVVNLCRVLERSPAGKIVYFSSAAVYGEDIDNSEITEQTCVQPRSYYGAAKFAAECLFRKHVEAYPQTSLVCLRPPLIYGPGDAGETYGPSGFVRKALRGEQITLWGDGRELREFVFLDDIVEVVARLTFGKFSGTINVASGTSYSFRQALDLLSHVAGRSLLGGSRERTKRSVDNCFVNAALKAALPNFAFVDLETGVRRTYETERVAGEARQPG